MERKRPKQLILEVTNRCNLRCKYCPNTCNDSFPVGDMTLSMFESAVRKLKEESPDTTVIPWMNGEPFLNPNYLEMLKILSGLGLKFYVTTNLTIWDEEILKFLLSDRSTCYQIIISMDGLPHSGSIELARPGTDEAQLLKNLGMLMRMKGEMDSSKDLAVKICERGQDWEEIEDYIQYWLNDREIDYVCVGKPLKDENESSMRTHPCQYFDSNFMIIRWDGSLVPCAYNDHVANELALAYGVYKEGDSLLDLYNNPSISWLRNEQNNGRFPYPCDKCSFAYTGFGFEGMGQFRKDRLDGEPVFFHQDYYNMFFSLKKKWKPNEYYLGGKP